MVVSAAPRRHSHTRAARWTLAAFAVLLSTLAGEGVWRVLVNAHYREQRRVFDAPLYVLTDDDTLYLLRANAEVEHTIPNPAGGPATHVVYHVDAEGLRAHPAWPPPAGPGRILFVGDSYTFGTAVPDGVSFPHQSERLLRARGRDVFCINAGVPGHNSEQTLAYLPSLLRRFAPRHVVLGFTTNDAEPPVFAPIPPAMLRGHARSWLLEDGKQVVNALGNLLVADAPLLHAAALDYDHDPLVSWSGTSPKGHASLREITAMQNHCAAAGITFSVVTLPSFWLPLDGDYPYRGIHGQVAAHARAAGAFALDALPALLGADHRALAVPGDGHPNEQGHQRLAQAIADHLAAVLP